MGVKSIICMPTSAPKVKIDSTIALGGEVVLVEDAYDDAYEKALELQAVLNNLVSNLTKESKVVTIISGGNIDIDMLARIVQEGL